jgi:hypothetical protein
LSAGPAAAAPTDPAHPLQFGLQAVNAPAAWARGIFGRGVRVAVLDTGIVWYHPDITPNLDMEDSASFVAGESVFVDAFRLDPAVGVLSIVDHALTRMGEPDRVHDPLAAEP